MSGSNTRVGPDSTGNRIATQTVTRGSDPVHRQEACLAGATGDTNIVDVLASEPTAANVGLVVRPIPSYIGPFSTFRAVAEAVVGVTTGTGHLLTLFKPTSVTVNIVIVAIWYGQRGGVEGTGKQRLKVQLINTAASTAPSGGTALTQRSLKNGISATTNVTCQILPAANVTVVGAPAIFASILNDPDDVIRRESLYAPTAPANGIVLPTASNGGITIAQVVTSNITTSPEYDIIIEWVET